jgi:proteasome assembly chaperone 1
MDTWINLDLDTVSRNWDDDEVENEMPVAYKTPVLEWTKDAKQTNNKIQSEYLVIAVNTAASLFFHSLIEGTKSPLIGTLQMPELAAQVSKHKSSLHDGLYQLTPNVVVVLVTILPAAERGRAWTSTLLEHVTATNVYVFDTMLDSRYRDKSGRRPMPPYVRKLETDARKALNADKMITDDCLYYETPNMVEELPAAILTYCQLRKIPAALYLSLEEGSYLRSETLKAFEHVVDVLMSNDLSEIMAKCPRNYTALLKTVRSNKSVPSDLYM